MINLNLNYTRNASFANSLLFTTKEILKYFRNQISQAH